MPDRKKNSPEEVKKAFLAYEAALSPITMAIALAFLGNFLDKHFIFFQEKAVLVGAILGLILGFIRLLKIIKKL